jgi:hypothetical protein
VHLPPRGEIKSAPGAAALHLVSEIYGCLETISLALTCYIVL